ncbi:MAG: hypothetical protein AAF749_06185 [Pseudomonadota bacterium]
MSRDYSARNAKRCVPAKSSLLTRSFGISRSVIIGVVLSSSLYSIESAALLGGGKSGNKFDYEACGKIVEGKTSYQEAEKMLGAEPISTGKNPVGFFRHYQYEKQGGLAVRAFGMNVGGSKAKSYKCFVIHNADGIITSVDMQATGVDGANTGL